MADDQQPTHAIRLLTAEMVAHRLSMSARTVRRLIADGKLPSIRIGAAVRVEESALRDFVRANQWRSGLTTDAGNGRSSSSKGERAYSSACQPVSRKRKRRNTKPSSAVESLIRRNLENGPI